jgi:hypothetical protein
MSKPKRVGQSEPAIGNNGMAYRRANPFQGGAASSSRVKKKWNSVRARRLSRRRTKLILKLVGLFCDVYSQHLSEVAPGAGFLLMRVVAGITLVSRGSVGLWGQPSSEERCCKSFQPTRESFCLQVYGRRRRITRSRDRTAFSRAVDSYLVDGINDCVGTGGTGCLVGRRSVVWLEARTFAT